MPVNSGTTELLGVLLIAAAGHVRAGADWGSITTKTDGTNQQNHVTLENSVMRVKYAYNDKGTLPQDGQHAIKELILKERNNRNLCGDYMDVGAHRYYLSSATVVCDTGNTKSVHMTWEQRDAQSTVTIYKDLKIIKIEYTATTPNVVDLNTNAGSHYYIYGSENWPRSIDAMGYPKCYYHRGDNYCAGQNGESGSNDDPAPLLYNGWFITGIYGDDGAGYGRIMPSTLDIIKLLKFGPIGFEYFWRSYTGFMFAVTGGAAEIEETGKMLADWTNAGEPGLPGDDTPVRTVSQPAHKRGTCPARLIVSSATSLSRIEARQDAVARVFSLAGRLVLTRNIPAARSLHLDQGLLPAGAYVVQVSPTDAVSVFSNKMP